ncbi:flagellar brake protein [Pseudodesulfovibrio sp. S3-i]|uniref:flagellar brake protein n=1 Tax=Pseudodesulfovibrio sp. S3-i TaxID=2929474 RepID=UPI001FBBE81A|nr:flagellar brake protein [Pseudodesulfovibrio sp. S3-i]MCJ2166291.1 flagellar brake protein [Pseudodesulfovibrio sp. S3-i]
MSEPSATDSQNNTIVPAESKVVKMSGVQLRVSLGKDVVIRIPGVEQSYRGKIVGYDPYDYLIASVRMPSKVRKSLSMGGQIIVKYILQGTVYGFKTHVQNAITSPTSLIFFDYPSVIEKVDLRRDTRTSCSIQSTLQTEKTEHECLIVNISLTGCQVSVQAGTRDPISNITTDDALVVFVNLGAEGTLKLPIAVRNIKRKKGLLILGTMFLDLNDKEEERIKQYLDRMGRLTR